MKNVYLHPAENRLKKLLSPLLLLMLLALLPAKTFAAAAPTIINSMLNSQGVAITGSPISLMPGQSFVVNFNTNNPAGLFYFIELSNPDGSFSSTSSVINYGANGALGTTWATGSPANKIVNFAGCIPISTAPGNYKISVSAGTGSSVNLTTAVISSNPVDIVVTNPALGFCQGLFTESQAAVKARATIRLTPAACGAHFYDDGGPSANYIAVTTSTSGSDLTPTPNSGNATSSTPRSIIIPPTGYKLVLTFNSYVTGSGDKTQIFDSPDLTGTVLFGGSGGLGGTQSVGTLTATNDSGALTVAFLATSTTRNSPGWDATVSFIVPAPTGGPTEIACSGGTVADLTATVAPGAGLNWYDASSGGSLLDPSTPLVDGTHYFASQTAGTCESTDRLDVTVSLIAGPSAPVAAAGTGATTSQITANWGTVSGATGYFLDVATDNGFNNFVSGFNNLSVGNVLTKNVTGLSAGTPYFYRVRVTNGTCTSDNSNTITYSTVGNGCPFVGGSVNRTFSIICPPNGTQALSVSGSTGDNYQWQISTDNLNWTDISGATTTSYTTATSDGNSNKFYRLMSKSTTCYNVTSNTAEVDISNPTIAVTASNITDNSVTVNWGPTGTGNYSLSYSGTSSATQTSVTPSKTITGLSSSGNYDFVVTQTGVSGCSASGTVTGVKTLCAMPTGVTLSSPANAQILVSWTGVPSADYRVYYRPLFAYGYFFTKDVSGVSSALITKQGNNNIYGNATYEVYVSRLDCPTTGAVGQGTNPTNVTTLPLLSCETPVIDSVRSLCPVQMEIFIHPGSSPTNTYNVYLQRLTPTILAVNSYGVSGNYFTINTPYSGSDYLIAIDSKCGGGATSALYVSQSNLTLKPLCSSPANLVLSNPTCHGFTASWNGDQCFSNTASAYAIYLRVAGTINYNSYGVSLPANGFGPNKLINWLTLGRNYQVFVRSLYSCNGFITYGPPSQVQTITTLSSGCRDEDVQQPEETKPAVQQYSADNQEIFSLYPNPSNGEFMVDLSRFSTEEDAVRIEVINMLGQTVMTHLTTISDGHMNEFINLPNGITSGTYIVRLTAGKNIYTAKVNVNR